MCNWKCIRHDSTQNYVFSHDKRYPPTNYLIMPDTQIPGIECNDIFQEPLNEIWDHGWTWSRAYPGRDESLTGMAINSKCHRDQDQLHIHVSCVHATVREFLKHHDAEIPNYPAAPISRKLGPYCTSYEIVKVLSLKGGSSPFKVVQNFPRAKHRMDLQSIAVVGSQKKKQEYFVLNSFYQAQIEHTGHAEDLLDETCSETDDTDAPECPQ